jgi:hypothetical protein
MALRRLRSHLHAPVAAAGLALVAGCGDALNGGGDGNGDAGPPACPAVLPEAEVGCADPACSAATGDRRVAEATLEGSRAGEWLVVLSAADPFLESDPTPGDVTVNLGLEVPGALLPRGPAVRSAGRWLERQPAELRDRLERRAARVAAESQLRAGARARAASVERTRGVLGGTGIRPAPSPGAAKQTAACSASSPACGGDAVCRIPVGSDDGTCEAQLALAIQPELRPGPGAEALPVDARVRTVTESVAILTDVNDSVTDDDVNELARRFDEHIGPLDHAFFGTPTDDRGRDFDGNGVVLVVLTERVAEVDANLVGFFTSDDMMDPTADDAPPWSNGADLLFMRPPGPSVSLDQLSGTIAHEYQHLINFFTKVVEQGSEPEQVWLDEGISSFAEDLTGYGRDAFENVALYLDAVPLTSLISGGDSSERRGMAHLLVRYLFEQAGGAEFPAAGTVNDQGGVAAVRRLVQSADTGTELFSAAATGRDYPTWLDDLLVTVALDGTSISDVSCNPGYQFAPPTTSSYTGFQRGIDLRSSIPGTGISLSGPVVDPWAAADALPFTGNGGEIRRLSVSGESATIWLSTDVENAENFDFGFRAIVAE